MPQARTRARQRAAGVSTPQSIEEANICLQRIGELTATRSEVEAELQRKVEAFHDRCAGDTERLEGLEQEKSVLFDGLCAFAQARRAQLTRGGLDKIVKVPAGEFGWRKNPPSVSLENEERVIANIEELGRQELLRVKKEVDRQAILKDPDAALAIRGIQIERRETFFAKAARMREELKRVLTPAPVPVEERHTA